MAKPNRNPQPVAEDDLLRILKHEEADSSSYYASELAQKQAEAMDSYNGKLANDEHLPNRSTVVTPDSRDTINWMMPHLMRALSSGPELITVEDDKLDSGDSALKDSADYLSHVVFKDNAGTTFVHDFVFDGLVQRVGVARCWWEDPEEKPSKIVEGVTPEQLARYVSDPEYEVLAWEMDGEVPAASDDDGDESGESEEAPEGRPEPTYTLEIKHSPRVGRARIAVVPPEEFRINRRSRSIEESGYHGWKHEVFLAEVLAEFPEKAFELDPDNAHGSSAVRDDQSLIDADMRVLARYPDELNTGQQAARRDEARAKVWQMIEYLRIDADGDGVVELRRIRRVGDVILENDAVEETEFVAWSPVRIAHKLIGLSEVDLVLDHQRIRSHLTRRMLDGMSRSLAPRTFYNKNVAQDDTQFEDRLLVHDVGDAIGVNGNPNESIMIQQTPDVSSVAMAGLDYFDQRKEESSGVARAAQGIKPQAITDTASGIENLQSAANSRVEQVARWAALSLEALFGKVLRLLIAHQDHARIIKLNGKRMSIDPRRWSDEMSVCVHVGMAAESREKRIVFLDKVLTIQQAALKELGLGNPLVTLKHVRNTLALMSEAMGYKDSGRFWGDIPDDYKPPEPGKDPKQVEVEGKLQLQQADMQQRGQIEAQKLQANLQLQHVEMQGKQSLAAQDVEVQRAVAAAKAQSDREAAALKAKNDMQIAKLRMELEARIASERLAAEMELARWKTQMELAHAATLPNGDTTRLPANRPGGTLDA